MTFFGEHEDGMEREPGAGGHNGGWCSIEVLRETRNAKEPSW